MTEYKITYNVPMISEPQTYTAYSTKEKNAIIDEITSVFDGYNIRISEVE